MMQAENLLFTDSALSVFDNPARFFASLDKATLDLYGKRKSVALDGALGGNKKSFQSILHQCAALDFVIFGVATQQSRYLEWGLRALAYGFARQNEDGSFAEPDIQAVDPTDVAQFIACAAMADVMLSRSAMRRRYLKPLADLRGGIKRSIEWLYRHHQSLLRADERISHRLLFDSLAFCLSAELFQSQSLLQKGWLFQTVPLLLIPAANGDTDGGLSRASDPGLETLLLLYFLIFVSNPGFVNEILDALVPGVEALKSDILDAGTGGEQASENETGQHLCNLNVVKSLWLYAYISGDLASWRAGNQVLERLTLQSRFRVAMLRRTNKHPNH